MSLKQKRRLSLAAMAAGILLMFLPNQLLNIVGIALLAAGFVLNIAVIHCPKCSAWIGRYPGEFCKYCGAKIDWEGKREE